MKRHHLVCHHTCIYLHIERYNERWHLFCFVLHDQTATAQFILFSCGSKYVTVNVYGPWQKTITTSSWGGKECRNEWKIGEISNHKTKIWGQTGGGNRKSWERTDTLYKLKSWIIQADATQGSCTVNSNHKNEVFILFYFKIYTSNTWNAPWCSPDKIYSNQIFNIIFSPLFFL